MDMVRMSATGKLIASLYTHTVQHVAKHMCSMLSPSMCTQPFCMYAYMKVYEAKMSWNMLDLYISGKDLCGRNVVLLQIIVLREMLTITTYILLHVCSRSLCPYRTIHTAVGLHHISDCWCCRLYEGAHSLTYLGAVMTVLQAVQGP